ncbi:hypothetical protein DTO217A2_2487 [Paecilomyces variotii]|nr:hypothetical protein DTO217A2_2487 [Paecilomyces variotii]KAJ9366218.1 hypothetical protein DTO282E5_9107 [Paecilomyces variotii]KAJ9399700.1 hypothetical protein DTO282F9_3314 [Paecilomyces variotii]
MWSIWAVAIVVIVALLLRWLRSPLTALPGPLITNFTSIWIKYHELSANRRLYIHELHKKYGPVVRLSPNEVSFTSLEAVKEIYASGGSGYDRTELYNLFAQFGEKTMFSTLGKKDHSQRKRCFADRYSLTNIMRKDSIASIQKNAIEFIRKCMETSGTSVDVYVLLHCYALDCVTHFMFSPGGTHSLTSVKDFELMEELTYHNSLQRLERYFPKFLLPRLSPKSDQYVLDKVEEGPSADEYSLVRRLLSKDNGLRNIQVAAECKDHMAAGIDTTGDGLCFLMWELSQPHNSHIQERLHLEVSGAFADTTLEDLPYLDAVVKEALRLAPPIPMSFPRYVPKGGCMIDGYHIPEGTIVSCQPYSVHRLNEKVFPRPDTFFPERWLNPDGASERNRLFFAFSTGARGCTGKNLALVEMKILLREVYSRFKTEVAPDMHGSMDIDDQIISARPKDQTCKLIFTPYEGKVGI